MEKLSLLEVRHRQGLTQQELAEKLGVSRNYVALVENGKKPFTNKLRSKLSQVNNYERATVADPTKSNDCLSCADKDKEIAWLKDQLSKALDALVSKPSPAAGTVHGSANGGFKAG